MENKPAVKTDGFKTDIFIVVILVLVATGLMLLATHFKFFDAAISPILTSTSVIIYIAAATHVTRRIIIPSVSLNAFMAKALEGNTAAAIVAAAIIYLICTLMEVGVALLR